MIKGLFFRLKSFSLDFTIYNGGPVEQDNLYFIHRVPHLIKGSIEISNGIYWGGDFNTVIDLLQMEKLKTNDIRFFLGYSGWSPSQLEEELSSNSWVIQENVYKNEIIEKGHNTMWKEKIIELGGDYLIWSNAPENPLFN